jgi:hypothetical protein
MKVQLTHLYRMYWWGYNKDSFLDRDKHPRYVAVAPKGMRMRLQATVKLHFNTIGAAQRLARQRRLPVYLCDVSNAAKVSVVGQASHPSHTYLTPVCRRLASLVTRFARHSLRSSLVQLLQ